MYALEQLVRDYLFEKTTAEEQYKAEHESRKQTNINWFFKKVTEQYNEEIKADLYSMMTHYMETETGFDIYFMVSGQQLCASFENGNVWFEISREGRLCAYPFEKLAVVIEYILCNQRGGFYV
jgi:outer membrane protease